MAYIFGATGPHQCWYRTALIEPSSELILSHGKCLQGLIKIDTEDRLGPKANTNGPTGSGTAGRENITGPESTRRVSAS